ncbi:putative RNA methyltransferase [Murinocardiopsis flavida]
MPPAVLRALGCTHCGAALDAAGNALRCAAGHSFDVAREGYANLLTGHRAAGTGDSAAMVQARAGFQASGHYAPLADTLAEAARTAAGGAGLVADLGAGTGYYLGRVLDDRPESVGVAADVSRYALRRAAKAHPRSGAVGCDVWRRLPLRDGAATVLLNVFAPRNAPEFHRVLNPGGALIVATPTVRHLAELRAPLGLIEVDPAKDERLAEGLGGHFTAGESRRVDVPLLLDRSDAAAVVAMGPSARHVDPAELDRRVAELPAPMPVTASFSVAVYRPLRRR